MEVPNIYNFKDPVSFLEAVFRYKKNKDPNYSVRKFAAEVDLKSSEILTDILKRKKKISLFLCDILTKKLDLDLSEQNYFEALVKYEAASTLKERNIMDLVIAELRHLQGSKVNIEDQSIFSHWVHMAIISMTKIEKFHCKRENIRFFLHTDLEQEIIDSAIERLLNHNLIHENEGVLHYTHTHTTSKNDAFKFSPHPYFEQVSELAKKGALIEADKREFQCFSMALKAEKLPAYKEAFRQFRAKLSEIGGDDLSELDSVYQVNLQFFPLTKPNDNCNNDKESKTIENFK